MANGDYEIDEQTFSSMPLEKQNWIMYKTFNAHRTHCDERMCKLEKQMDKSKLWDKLITVGVSAGTGMLAALGFHIQGKGGP